MFTGGGGDGFGPLGYRERQGWDTRTHFPGPRGSLGLVSSPSPYPRGGFPSLKSGTVSNTPWILSHCLLVMHILAEFSS